MEKLVREGLLYTEILIFRKINEHESTKNIFHSCTIKPIYINLKEK